MSQEPISYSDRRNDKSRKSRTLSLRRTKQRQPNREEETAKLQFMLQQSLRREADALRKLKHVSDMYQSLLFRDVCPITTTGKCCVHIYMLMKLAPCALTCPATNGWEDNDKVGKRPTHSKTNVCIYCYTVCVMPQTQTSSPQLVIDTEGEYVSASVPYLCSSHPLPQISAS